MGEIDFNSVPLVVPYIGTWIETYFANKYGYDIDRRTLYRYVD